MHQSDGASHEGYGSNPEEQSPPVPALGNPIRGGWAISASGRSEQRAERLALYHPKIHVTPAQSSYPQDPLRTYGSQGLTG
jgi:hypothetical protein